MVLSEQSGLIIDMGTGNYHDMPSGLFKILALIDGVTPIQSICEHLTATYQVTTEEIYNSIVNLGKKGILNFNNTPSSSTCYGKKTIRIISIELTDKCNLKCRYCYGAFAPNNKSTLTFEEIELLFAKLSERGVRIIELTGGEPTLNPSFNSILELACLNFHSVTIMTNAVAFNDKSFELFKNYSTKIGFSISIDGFSESTNSFQRNTFNTFTKTLNNILRIKQEVDPRYLRIVYMLTNENEHEVEQFYEFMIANGIKNIMMSIPEHIEKGRTYSLPDGCSMSDHCSKSRLELEQKGMQIGQKYLDSIQTISDNLGKDGLRIANALPGCGAGWTMLSLKSQGDVLPCNMMGDEWKLGNFKDDPTLSFLSHNNPLYSLLANINLSVENGNRDECVHCEYQNYCGKCINKIFIANKQRILEGCDLCPILKKYNFSKNYFASK